MAGPNPWDNDPVVGSVDPSSIGRPVIHKGAPVPTPQPKTLSGGYAVDLNSGTAQPVAGLPREHFRPLTPNDGQLYVADRPGIINEQTGDVKYGPQGAKPEVASDQSEEAAHTTDILDQITHVRDLARKPGAIGNLAAHSYFQAIPIIGQNAADVGANVNQIRGDLIQQGIARLKMLNGGESASSIARNKAEQQALADAAAALDQKQSYESFSGNLDKAEQLYKRQLGRFYDKGLIDDATANKYGITHSPDFAPKTQDNGITASNAPPQILGAPDTGISTDEQSVLNPQVAKIAPQLTEYLNADPKKVSNAMILGFVQKNGVNPSDWPQLQDALKNRGKRVFNVDPHFNKPLSDEGVIPGTSLLSEQDRAQAAASPTGAALTGALDTASFGATPEIAGAIGAVDGQGYSDARKNFIDKQQLIAAAHPTESLGGNLLGGLSQLAVAAPATLGKLILQSALQSGAYGALSSEDPSLGGRLSSGVRDAVIGAVTAPIADLGFKGLGTLGSRGANILRSTEDAANGNALASFAAHAPNQDVPAMRARAAEQSSLGIEPTAINTLDRSGQDYVGRQVSKSPGARQAADEAVTKAEADLPEQLRGDFTQAIDAAAGNGEVSKFLNRPAREITSDIQDLAGREFEAGIEPIKKEPVPLSEDLMNVLTDEQAGSAIRDALKQPGLDQETKDALRTLPRHLQQVANMDPKLRDQVLKSGGININVEMAQRIARGFDRMANKLDPGSDLKVQLRDLSKTVRDDVSASYPEFQEANARYASRKRAIEALDSARDSFMGDGRGGSDKLARATGRLSGEPGAPEFPDGETPTPSQKDMARAGAREAVSDKAGEGNPLSTAKDLNTPNQQERNAMVLGDAAKGVQAKAAARSSNLDLLKRIQSGGQGDETGGKVSAGLKAAANAAFHRGGAMIASGLSGIRGVSPEDAARIVKLYTTPGKAEAMVSDLERRYGYRKARFIISRIGALTAAAQNSKSRPLAAPPE